MAKARGLDTTQTYPRCGQVVDEARSLGECNYSCTACREHEAETDRIADAEEDVRRIAEVPRRAALTPEQRDSEDREAIKFAQIVCAGLMQRDVQ